MANGSATIQDEVEIKLDAGPEFTLPDLTGLPGVTRVETGDTHELSAYYVDSADLALARHGTTFRRRSGGSDEGWHLKLPSGKQGRTEVHEPIGDSIHDIPASLLALVRVQLRGGEVAPVARVVTHRTTLRLLGAQDEVLAEVADDRVTAESLGEKVTTQHWREIEVELAPGHGDDRKLLKASASLLREAGAAPSPAGSKLARALGDRLDSAGPRRPTVLRARGKRTAGAEALRYLDKQARALVAEDPHVRLDIKDGVHQMRVATRRLRTALATFRPFFEPSSAEPLRAELKWLGGVLGEARDAEVMRKHLREQVAELPEELVLGPVARRIDLELNQAHQEAHGRVIETLDGERYLALVDLLERFVAEPPLTARAARPAERELQRRVSKACARVTASVAVVDAAESADERDNALHDVRKAAKRARYAAEAAKPVGGKQAKQVQAAMEAIQEDLGDHQDAVVERSWLRDLGARAYLNGENGFTFGLLHGRTLLRAEHDEQQFEVLWKQARSTIARWPG